ncbi:AMP-binding protein [Nakamurella sp. YIM 132087]|uniref:AMP-binding protein n=1 Tax=Nakamurella alba TaxID=2665158 RepID=A0A7K1FEB8_9ACTN|nr:class I adenylate-forming enzyme family protein [Nakamurella alba]MTD12426.1 AMP-binding protein [Nakamurella alba]
MTTPGLIHPAVPGADGAVGWEDEPDRLGSLLIRQAVRRPDDEYVSFGGERWTYRRFSGWVDAVAADLVGRGIGRGDRILIQVPNRLEALVLQLAAFRIGAVDVPVIPIYREHELRHILDDARPAAVAVAATVSSRTPPTEIDTILSSTDWAPRVRYVIGGDADGWVPFRDLPESVDDVDLPEPGRPDEPALILYTSGTTAKSKGAVLTARECLAHARNWVSTFQVRSDDVYLVGTPLSHLGGFNAAILLPLFTGARVVVLPHWRAIEAAEIAEQEAATVMLGAALFLSEMVDIYASGRFSDRPIRLYASAGSVTPPALIRRAADFGVTAGSCYGMTEAGTLSGFGPGDPLERRAELDGRIFPSMTVEAVDELRRVLPPFEEGELRVRGPQVMERYTDPAASARQLDDEGWFYTGDVGYVTDDGWLKMTGRLKDIINRGGEKFSAQEIELALVQHPDVLEVAVAGLPDERFGERVAAFLRLSDGVVWNGPQPLLDHLDALGFAKQKFPVTWRVLAEGLPRTASGKVRKNVLIDAGENDAALPPVNAEQKEAKDV